MSNDDNDKKTVSFEQAIAELGQLVSKLEAGELSLESSIDAYKRGVELIRFCTTCLDNAERQVQILDGELLKPFSPENQDGADND